MTDLGLGMKSHEQIFEFIFDIALDDFLRVSETLKFVKSWFYMATKNIVVCLLFIYYLFIFTILVQKINIDINCQPDIFM